MEKTIDSLFQENKSLLIKGEFALAKPYTGNGIISEDFETFRVFIMLKEGTFEENIYLNPIKWTWKENKIDRNISNGSNRNTFQRSLFSYEGCIDFLLLSERQPSGFIYNGVIGMYKPKYFDKCELNKFERLYLNGYTFQELLDAIRVKQGKDDNANS